MIATPKRYVRTVKEAAAELGISTRRVHTLMLRGLPFESGKKNDLEPILDWYKNFVDHSRRQKFPEKEGQQRPVVSLEKRLEVEIEKMQEDVISKRIKNQQLAGELVDRRAVLQSVSELAARIKLRLESIPDEIRMQLPPDLQIEIIRAWKEKISLTLAELERMKIGNDDTVRELVLEYAKTLE